VGSPACCGDDSFSWSFWNHSALLKEMVDMPAHQRPTSVLMVPGSVYFWGHVQGGTVFKLFNLVVVHARRVRGVLRCDHIR